MQRHRIDHQATASNLGLVGNQFLDLDELLVFKQVSQQRLSIQRFFVPEVKRVSQMLVITHIHQLANCSLHGSHVS